jgi:DNA-binding response OmpR family regulator
MLEKVKILTHRIRKILEGSKICVVDADNENTLFNSLNGTSDSLALVLMDLDLNERYAMDLLIETRKRVKTSPIIIMTSENTKKVFIEAMLQGATDFIIKPFTNQLFIEKIKKYLTPPEFNGAEIVSMDLRQYIKGELRKAEKGNFPLSLMFMYFENNSADKSKDHEINNFIFNNMQKLFWDTDLFIRFASEHGVGIFPFCNEKNTEIIKNKIEAKFQELKNDNEALKEFNMLCAFLSYPHDTSDTTKVFEMFISRINSEFQDLQLSSDAVE